MKHVISVKQFQDKSLLEDLFESAAKFQSLKPSNYPKVLENKIVATLFYEPSTRTRLSFESAVQRLDGMIISTESAGQFSSAAKGETIEDTIRIIMGYADAIVIRHPERGSAEQAAACSTVPIINAGDGTGEHPTQALLDLYTIQKSKGKVDGLKIGLVGDLVYGRTIHSLIQLLKLYNVTLYFIAPDVLQLPDEYQKLLRAADITFELMPNWNKVIDQVDVLYMTRIQKERFKSEKDYDAVKNSFILSKADLEKLRAEAVILHPLPRVIEIPPEVDSDPRALYFEQAKNGLYLRMALLEHIFSK